MSTTAVALHYYKTCFYMSLTAFALYYKSCFTWVWQMLLYIVITAVLHEW